MKVLVVEWILCPLLLLLNVLGDVEGSSDGLVAVYCVNILHPDFALNLF